MKPATERKSTKSKFKMSLGTTSAPPKFKIAKEVIGMLHEKQYNRINRNLFCQPENYDDRDFYLNNQPGCLIRYDGTESNLEIPS
ncbi:hypothetical protein RYX36_005425, partial [Vicia faba]